MVQSRTRKWMLILVWAAMIGVATDLGLERAWALPACTVCACKKVSHWFAPAFTVHAKAYKLTGTATDTVSALPNIQTAVGTCDAGQYKNVSGQNDVWDFLTGYYICTPANTSLTSEVSVTDTGFNEKTPANKADCVVGS